MKKRLKNNKLVQKAYWWIMKHICRPCLLRSYRKWHYSLQIHNLKNIHQGNRCFIIGNGPSLRIEDLDKLVGEYTFATNKIDRLFPKTRWRPTYYILGDNGFVKHYANNAKHIPCKKLLVGLQYTDERYRYEGIDNVVFFLKKDVYHNGIPTVNLTLETEVHAGHTTLFMAAEFAMYMGFSEIYFIGCDCNYDGLNQHFYSLDEDTGIGSYKVPSTEGERMVCALGEIGRYGKHIGIKVCNATRGGKLNSIERVEFDSLFKQNPT